MVYYGGEDLLAAWPGQTVEATVKFQDSARLREDTITNFTSKGVFLLAYQRGDAAVYGEGSAGSPRWWPALAARAMQQRIGELFSGDAGGFLNAILTGDKTGLSEEASSDLSEAGLSHILAVSGMHCGFLMTLVLLFTGSHRRRLVAGLGVPILVFYALLTGASPSVVRACVMLLFVLAAPLFGRDSDPPTTMFAALFCILLANPFAAASVSLQLSFGAVAGLLWLTPRVHGLLLGDRPRGKLYRLLSSSVSSTVGALVFTVPLCAVYFGSVVLISPVSNLLCLTASSAVFMLGLLAVLASFLLPPLGAVIGFVPSLLAEYILWVSGLLAAIPHHAVYLTNPYVKVLAGVRVRAVRRRVPPAAQGAEEVRPGGGPVGALPGGHRWSGRAPLHPQRPGRLRAGRGAGRERAADLRRTVRPGGLRQPQQLVRRRRHRGGPPGHHGLRDAGLPDPDPLRLRPRLRRGGAAGPGAGGDAPAAGRGGRRGDALRVELAAASHGAEVRYVEAETDFPLGESGLTVYPPAAEGGDNERCLAILCTRGDYDLLITGDMDMAAERQLIATYSLPDIETLVVGHHGSRSSTSEELLEALTPETAVISVGDNSYGHPAEDALRRLVLSDVEIFRTDKQGTVHLSVN